MFVKTGTTLSKNNATKIRNTVELSVVYRESVDKGYAIFILRGINLTAFVREGSELTEAVCNTI